MSADSEHRPTRAPAPATLMAGSATRLRVAALPALWAAWAEALEESRTTGDDARPRLASFDAAVVEFTLAAKEQGAAVTTILRVLDILAREVAGEAAATRVTTLRDRAGRVSMSAYYRSNGHSAAQR